MSNARPIHPLHNLKQTAFDLAYYLRYAKPAEINEVITEVRKKYNAPNESWIWAPAYWLVNARKRTPDLDKAIDTINATVSEDENVGLRQSQTIIDLVTVASSGWDETSVNTNIMRRLVRKLHGYDPTVVLSTDAIIELKTLLITAIENRIEAEANLNDQESKLKEIQEKRLKIEKDLFDTQKELLQKREEIKENEDRVHELEKLQSNTDSDIKEMEREKERKKSELMDYEMKIKSIAYDKAQREEALKKIESEISSKEAELQEAREKLLTLNPEFDIKTLKLHELHKIMDEAKKVGEIAVKTFLAERQNQMKKEEEIKAISKKNLSEEERTKNQAELTQENSQEEKEKLEAQKQEKLEEIKKLCKKGATIKNTEFLSHLNLLLKMQKDKDKEIQSAANPSIYEAGSIVHINDPVALANISLENMEVSGEKLRMQATGDTIHTNNLEGEIIEPEKKSRISFKDMVIAGPRSQNPSFLKAFAQVGTLFRGREEMNDASRIEMSTVSDDEKDAKLEKNIHAIKAF